MNWIEFKKAMKRSSIEQPLSSSSPTVVKRISQRQRFHRRDESLLSGRRTPAKSVALMEPPVTFSSRRFHWRVGVDSLGRRESRRSDEKITLPTPGAGTAFRPARPLGNGQILYVQSWHIWHSVCQFEHLLNNTFLWLRWHKPFVLLRQIWSSSEVTVPFPLSLPSERFRLGRLLNENKCFPTNI